jgi:hypothetical protein
MVNHESPSANYDTLGQAARGLLGEASAIALESGKEFAVCGGWSTVLRNTTRFPHPGTRDVDLLFADGVNVGALQGVVQSFLNHGYLISAKHEFQVLRVLKVRSREFVFNVDLLHPTIKDPIGSLFVDQLELPIPREDFRSTHIFMMSIALPDSGFVFDGYIDTEEVECLMPNGTMGKQSIPVIDEVGIIATKSKSCLVQKRPRDLFDIYLAISSPKNAQRFAKRIERLRDYHEGVYASLECIGEALTKWETKWDPPGVFASHGIRFSDAAKEIRAFLKDIGFDTK